MEEWKRGSKVRPFSLLVECSKTVYLSLQNVEAFLLLPPLSLSLSFSLPISVSLFCAVRSYAHLRCVENPRYVRMCVSTSSVNAIANCVVAGWKFLPCCFPFLVEF